MGIDAIYNHKFSHIYGPDRRQFPVGGKLGRVDGRIICMSGDRNF